MQHNDNHGTKIDNGKSVDNVLARVFNPGPQDGRHRRIY